VARGFEDGDLDIDRIELKVGMKPVEEETDQLFFVSMVRPSNMLISMMV
jgi:hypothetical protein